MKISSHFTKMSVDDFSLERQNRTEIKNHKGKIGIKQDKLEISVDNYPPRYDLGYKNIKDLRQQMVQTGKEQALKAIRETAETGDLLMDFQNNYIATIAAEQAFNREDVEVQLQYIRSPEINVKG